MIWWWNSFSLFTRIYPVKQRFKITYWTIWNIFFLFPHHISQNRLVEFRSHVDSMLEENMEERENERDEKMENGSERKMSIVSGNRTENRNGKQIVNYHKHADDRQKWMHVFFNGIRLIFRQLFFYRVCTSKYIVSFRFIIRFAMFSKTGWSWIVFGLLNVVCTIHWTSARNGERSGFFLNVYISMTITLRIVIEKTIYSQCCNFWKQCIWWIMCILFGHCEVVRLGDIRTNWEMFQWTRWNCEEMASVCHQTVNKYMNKY